MVSPHGQPPVSGRSRNAKEGLPAPERRQHGAILKGGGQGTHGAEWDAESTGWADAEVEGDGLGLESWDMMVIYWYFVTLEW